MFCEGNKGFPSGTSGKELACHAADIRDTVRSLSQEDPCRRAWQLTPVFLPGESHGQSSLVGYSPWGCKETQLKQLSMHAMHEGNKQETGTERTRGRVAHMAHIGTQDKLC